MRKPLIGIAGLVLLAGAVTAGIFSFRGGLEGKPQITGKLSSRAVEVEGRCKEAFASWKANQAQFSQKKEFPKLGHLNETFTNLHTEAKGLTGDTPAEKAAMPHLVTSLELSQKVASTFIMFQVNESLVKPENWAKAKQEADQANAEWEKWLEMTKTLSR